MRAKTFDLVVLPSVHPDHGYDQPRFKVGAKRALEGIARSPAAVVLHRLIGSTAHVIMDIRDEPYICETSIRLFPHHLWYFKRELDFSQTTQLSKVRPLPLFLQMSVRLRRLSRKASTCFSPVLFAMRFGRKLSKRQGALQTGASACCSDHAVALCRIHGGNGQVMAGSPPEGYGLGLLPPL